MEQAQRRNFLLSTSALLAAAVASFAQTPQAKIPRIGFLGVATPAAWAPRIDAFRAGLRDLGYVEDKNIVIEFRFAEGQYDRLPALAAELVRLKVDVIVTHSVPGALAAKEATATIPIPVVMTNVGDAVERGIVASLARPGGNITGDTFFAPELAAKRLEVTLVRFDARGPDELNGIFAAMVKERVDSLAVVEDPALIPANKQIAELAVKQRLPSIGFIEYVDAGGLFGYGVNFLALYRRAPVFVDKILKGAKPADVPIERPTMFNFVINLKTAKALGLTIPQSVLMRADEMIE